MLLQAVAGQERLAEHQPGHVLGMGLGPGVRGHRADVGADHEGPVVAQVLQQAVQVLGLLALGPVAGRDL